MGPVLGGFARLLRSTFHDTLERGVVCAREDQLQGRRTPVEALLTGGGRSLPMVTDFITDPPFPIRLDEASPEIPEGPLDQTFLDLRPQLAVAVGGAVMDLPHQTARVRIRDVVHAAPRTVHKIANAVNTVRDIVDAAQAVHDTARAGNPPLAANASGPARVPSPAVPPHSHPAES